MTAAEEKPEAPTIDVSVMLGRALAITRICADAIYNGNDTDNAVGESLEAVIEILNDMEEEIDRWESQTVKALALAQAAQATKKKAAKK